MGEVIAPRLLQDSLIRIYKNAYTDEFCDKAVSAYETITQHEEEASDHTWSEIGYRRDSCVFMDSIYDSDSDLDKRLRKEVVVGVEEKLIQKVEEYMKDVGIFKDMYCIPYQVKVQKYDHTRGGGYYQFHSEQSAENEQYIRRALVYTLYLNDVPEGEGETEFLNQGFRYTPRKGDLVIFPAFFTHIHRGNPVYTTDKYITTGWMLWSLPPAEANEK